MKNVVLSNEDFQDFPIGEFPYDKDHTAMGEYQYVVENGYHGNWVDIHWIFPPADGFLLI